MSNENYNVEVKKEEKCFCHSKGFRKFLVVALGSFVGVFCALSLFAALHKPPMMAPCPCGCRMMPPVGCHHFGKFNRGPRGDFHKKMMMDKMMQQNAPVRVEVED